MRRDLPDDHRIGVSGKWYPTLLIVLPLVVIALTGAPLFAAELLANPGFEGSYTDVAPGWYQNTWGAPGYPQVNWGRETDPPHVHGGLAAQRIEVFDLGDGGTILAQAYDFPAGKVYAASVWLQADQPVTVAFVLQERGPDYGAPAAYVAELGPEWQEFRIEGGFGRSRGEDRMLTEGRFAIQPLETGTIWIDDAGLVDITGAILSDPTITNKDAIPRNYFGMHVNKLGVHETWPPLGFGLLRLWSTGTEWFRIEPWDGALDDPANWEWPGGAAFRFEYYVNLYAQANDPTADILYTMGMPPDWAAPDITLPPNHSEDWADYAAAVGNRFRGKIHFWEIWNEVNIPTFYTGDIGNLVELTEISQAKLSAIDPENRILSPNVTHALTLAELLHAAVAPASDIISWHDYPSREPEESVPLIIGIRSVLANYGLDGMPVWNTEGAVTVPTGEHLSESQQIGAVARSYLVQWAFGIRQFSWYAWDIYYDSAFDFVRLSYSVAPNDFAGTTAAGIAYRETADWLVGARLTRKEITGDRWILSLERPGPYRAWIVWNRSGPESFVIPPEWAVSNRRDLYGMSQPVTGRLTEIGVAPIMLERIAKPLSRPRRAGRAP